MVEREKGFTRREFLFKGGIVLSLWLAGCRAETITLYPPEATPFPPETIPPKEIIPYQEPEQPGEILSLAEVSQLYPLEIENKSSYLIEGINRAPLEEVMREVKIDSNQILNLTLEDKIGESTGKPTIKAIIHFYSINEEGFREDSSLFVEANYEVLEERLTEEERLSYDMTVALRMLLGVVSYLHPYIKDNELSEDEHVKINKELKKETEKIRMEVVSDIGNDRSKLIFIIAFSGTI